MGMNTYCDFCGENFELDKLDIKESTVKRGKNIERCVVQYFRCPNCKQEFVVCVFDERINKLNKKYNELLRHHEGMSLAKFNHESQRLKKQILAEESMLQHLYMKQHKVELKLIE